MNHYQYRSVFSIPVLLWVDRNVQRSFCGVKLVCIFFLISMMVPFIASAQIDAGAIAKSQCVLSGASPSAFTSLRDASGGTITWEKTTVDNTFLSGVSTIPAANGLQSYSEGAVAATTYYRRVVTSGGVPLYSNVIAVSIVGSVVNPTFTPSVPPFPIICQGTTSFPVNYTTTNTPDQYSIIWDATAAAAGFTDAVNLTLAATPGSFNVSVPANAPANTYNGTLIAVNTGTGCTVSNSSSVLVNPSPTVSITSPSAVCAPSTIDLTNTNITTGSTADTYTQWNDALATSSLTNANAITATGVYYIKGTITATGCSLIKPVTATINQLPTANITAGGPTAFCAGGSVTLTSSAGNSYSWNSGQSTQAIVVSSGANYAVTVTSAAGCSLSSSVTPVTVNPLPTVNITTPATVCAPLTVDLTNTNITTGSAADTYTQWNDALATSSLINANAITATGVYYIKGTIVATGCSVIKPVTATINQLPTATITASGPTTFCAGGSVTLTSSAGNSYSWNSGQSTQAIVVSSGANYAVTVTSAAGCSLSSSVTPVTVNPLPTVNIATPAAVCAPSTINLTSATITTGSTADSYTQWNDALATSSLTNANAVTVTGVYYIKGMIIATGCSVIKPVTATINQLPTATITASGPTTFCAGGSVTLTSSAGNSYLWNSGQTSQAIVVSTGANYAVTVTNAAGCSLSSSVTPVTVNALPTVNITTPTAVCAPSTIDLTSATIITGSTGGLSYTQWNNALATSSLTNANAVTATGVYYIKGTIVATGCAVTKPVTATINQLPAATITASGPTTFCAGGSVTLTSSAGNSYSWSSGQTTQSIVVSAGANYAVTITSAAGCSLSSSVMPVVVNPIPTVTITNPSPVCAPATIDLTTAAITNGSTGGLTYTYWTNASTTSSLTNTTAVNTGGTYFIKGTSAAGCSQVQPVSVIVNSQPTVNVTNPAAVCVPSVVDLTSASITSGSTAGLNFTYFTDASATSVLSTPVTVSSSGTYYIKGTFPSTGCNTIKPVTVIVNTTPVININNPAAVCEPATVDLTATAVKNGSSLSTTFTYWTDAATTIALASPSSVATSGTYYIKGTVAGGCSASKPVSVIINPLPVGVLQSPPVTYVCDGLSQTLTASGAYSYQWYLDQKIISGATAANYAATIGGNYTVQFISKDGCTKNATNIIVLALFVKPTVAFTADSRCVGSSINFTNNSSFASSGNVSWLWNFGDGSSSNNLSATHTYTSAGNYPVVLTANNVSCPNLTTSATNNYSIETALPGVRYDTIYSIGNKSFIINARSFGVSYLWQPSTGLRNAAAQSTIINLDSSVAYTVAITSSAGCVTTDSVFVKITNNGEIYVPQGFTPNGDGVNDRAYPILIGIKQLNYFKIFNRWGNIIFQTNDATPQNGWDGKYLGKMQPTGTYTWIAEAIDGNGNIIHRGGNILLLK